MMNDFIVSEISVASHQQEPFNFLLFHCLFKKLTKTKKKSIQIKHKKCEDKFQSIKTII